MCLDGFGILLFVFYLCIMCFLLVFGFFLCYSFGLVWFLFLLSIFGTNVDCWNNHGGGGWIPCSYSQFWLRELFLCWSKPWCFIPRPSQSGGSFWLVVIWLGLMFIKEPSIFYPSLALQSRWDFFGILFVHTEGTLQYVGISWECLDIRASVRAAVILAEGFPSFLVYCVLPIIFLDLPEHGILANFGESMLKLSCFRSLVRMWSTKWKRC